MLSSLQRHILRECLQRGGRTKRSVFLQFYPSHAKISPRLQVQIITKSLERLIGRGLLIGYGVRTKEKWFIKEVRITKEGRKVYDGWLASRQKKLPL